MQTIQLTNLNLKTLVIGSYLLFAFIFRYSCSYLLLAQTATSILLYIVYIQSSAALTAFSPITSKTHEDAKIERARYDGCKRNRGTRGKRRKKEEKEEEEEEEKRKGKKTRKEDEGKKAEGRKYGYLIQA